MVKVVEEYDPRAGLWTAKVEGEVVTGRTPRQMRSEVYRIAGASAEIDFKFKIPPDEQQAVNDAVKEGAAVEKLRQEYNRRLDVLNVKRLEIAERLTALRATMEMVASTLKMDTTRLQQMSDPRHYAGKRVRAIREGKIKPGSPPPAGRKQPKAADDDDD